MKFITSSITRINLILFNIFIWWAAVKNENWFIFMICGKSKKITMFSSTDVQFCLKITDFEASAIPFFRNWTVPDTWIHWKFLTKSKLETNYRSNESSDENSFKLRLVKCQVPTQPWITIRDLIKTKEVKLLKLLTLTPTSPLTNVWHISCPNSLTEMFW